MTKKKKFSIYVTAASALVFFLVQYLCGRTQKMFLNRLIYNNQTASSPTA